MKFAGFVGFTWLRRCEAEMWNLRCIRHLVENRPYSRGLLICGVGGSLFIVTIEEGVIICGKQKENIRMGHGIGGNLPIPR